MKRWDIYLIILEENKTYLINLNKILTTIAQRMVNELQFNVLNQRNLDGTPIQPVAASTQIARKNKGYSSITRLLLTGQFYRNAFKYVINGNKASIFVNPAGYPGSSVSYADIVKYNDRESDQVNQKIQPGSRPHIFPSEEKDIVNMKSFKLGTVDIEKEVQKELDSIIKNMTITITVM